MARSSTAENVVDMQEEPSTEATTKRTRKASGPRIRKPVSAIVFLTLTDAAGNQVDTTGLKPTVVSVDKDFNAFGKRVACGEAHASSLWCVVEFPAAASDTTV